MSFMKMSQRSLSRALVFFMAVFFSSQTLSQAEPLYKGKITIGAVVWPGYLALYAAEAKGQAIYTDSMIDSRFIRSIDEGT